MTPPSLQTRVSGVMSSIMPHRPPPSFQTRVGGAVLCLTPQTDPPSLQMRVGGPLLHDNTPPGPHLRSKGESVGYYLLFDTHGPTLTANASWWAFFFATIIIIIISVANISPLRALARGVDLLNFT
jgi:hypothetical protein